MDDPITKLPRYVFRRANGSYRYKRNVPKALRQVIPKATLYRQLGDSYDEAIRRLPVVHAEVEALFDQERKTPDSKERLEHAELAHRLHAVGALFPNHRKEVLGYIPQLSPNVRSLESGRKLDWLALEIFQRTLRGSP
jgi:hypothetical protein